MFRSLALAITLTACASKPTPAPTSTATASSAQPGACVQVMTRARACTAAFIPALVDARARHDVPAGIAAQVAADRAGVIAAANQEWATDSTDASIAQTCAKMPPSPDDATAASCASAADCDAFVQCAIPTFERRIASR